VFRKINSMRNSIHRSRSSGYVESRAFPDVRWMQISSLLQREKAWIWPACCSGGERFWRLLKQHPDGLIGLLQT
jgi:hypothetical protein